MAVESRDVGQSKVPGAPVHGGRGITNRKRTQPVIAERGPKRALVYFGANAGPGALRPAYIAEVLAAARSWPLPSVGLAALGRMAKR
jgi:hypothetical protein